MRLTRRLLLALGAAAPALAADPPLSPTPPAERRVGIGYTLWHTQADWMARAPGQRPWGRPELGYYVSSDRTVMRQHAAWLSAAHVDFVLLDWSNDLGTDTRNQSGPSDQLAIENTTPLLFDTWAGMRAPKIAFLIGVPGPMLRPAVQASGQDADLDVITAGALRAKADQIHAQYVANPRFAPVLEMYLGKPLLVVMIGVPCPYRQKAPTWTDPRFTVRFMTAYLPEQPGLATPGLVSTLGYWSWEDRGPPTYAVYQGHPEAMTVVAAWRDTTPGVGMRRNGTTYREEWARAQKIGPRYVLAGTFNEWWVSEQPSPETSKDIEPSVTEGHTYLDILGREAAAFKK